MLAVTFFVSAVSTDFFSVDVKCNYRSFLYVSWDFCDNKCEIYVLEQSLLQNRHSCDHRQIVCSMTLFSEKEVRLSIHHMQHGWAEYR